MLNKSLTALFAFGCVNDSPMEGVFIPFDTMAHDLPSSYILCRGIYRYAMIVFFFFACIAMCVVFASKDLFS